MSCHPAAEQMGMTSEPTSIASGLTQRQADDVVVLLAALGISARSAPEPAGTWSIGVDARDAAQASAIVLDEYPAGFVARPVAAAGPARTTPLAQPWLGRGTWAVVLVVVACVGWFVRMHAGGVEPTRARLLALGAITWDQVWVGEWWRLASALFVHFDGAHLVTNMLTLLIVGPPLASLLGPWRFLIIFFLTGVAGNLASHVLAASASLKGGASGAIAGVLGALGGTSLDAGWGGRFKRWQVVGALAAIYALLVGAAPGADHVAHLGGLVAGVVLGRLLTPRATAGGTEPPRRAAERDAPANAATTSSRQPSRD
jgi:membrane associated rhomboid family serine protease